MRHAAGGAAAVATSGASSTPVAIAPDARNRSRSTYFWTLPDGGDFVCCPGICAPMRDAIEAQRRQLAADRAQLALPLGAG